MLIRKQKKLYHAALGKLIGTSCDVIGRYERGDIKPLEDIISKTADASIVSIDFSAESTKLQLKKGALYSNLSSG